MFIPNAMKTEIAKAFYDKEIILMEKETVQDAEGGIKLTGIPTEEDSDKVVFKGNVNFSNCEKLQEEYGLDYKVNISITTNYNELKIDDIISYNELLYTVKGIYPRDSHVLILGANWRV